MARKQAATFERVRCTGSPELDATKMAKVDRRGLMGITLDAVTRFYENPENVKKFEAWQAARRAAAQA